MTRPHTRTVFKEQPSSSQFRIDHEAEATRVRNGRKWKRLSKMVRRERPLCERCGRLSEHVHHIVSVAIDPTRAFAWPNLEALCRVCHTDEHDPTRANTGGVRARPSEADAHAHVSSQHSARKHDA